MQTVQLQRQSKDHFIPFYPVFAQKDLTRIEGKQGVAKGKIIIIQGQVWGLENASYQ